MRHFPDMAFRIAEIAVIPAPEHLLRRFQHGAARRIDPAHDVVHTSPVSCVVAQRQRSAPKLRHVDPDILGQLLQRIKPQRLPQQIIGDHPVLRLNPHPAQRIVKRRRLVRIHHAQRDQRYPLLHANSFIRANTSTPI
jgi:hypothetical protein